MVVVGDIPADARPVNTNNRGGNGEPVSPWKNSRAKAQLAEMLKDRTSNVRTISVDAVWESNPLFRQYPWPRFKQNFKSLKKKIDDEAAAIAFDQRSYEHEQEKFPRNATTMRGQPFWNGHPAESLMEADVKQGIISGMKPKAVRQSRPEYQEFDLPTLRNHIYKEKTKQTQKPYWQMKRNKKGQPQHEAAVAEQRGETNE